MLVVIKGAGDLATGVALRLWRAGIRLVMTDLETPSAIRRTVAFSECMRLGETQVEGVTAVRAADAAEAMAVLDSGRIPVLADPKADCIGLLRPDAVVDVILAKYNTGTAITDAPVVIGVGPGFTAGEDCHAVVETQRGHRLGRVILDGSAAPNTGRPGNVGGYTIERLIRSHKAGEFRCVRAIGDHVEANEIVGTIDGEPVRCQIAGILRGLLPDGFPVPGPGFKSGDVDPRCQRENCFTASDKALAVGGGVLEALLQLSGALR